MDERIDCVLVLLARSCPGVCVRTWVGRQTFLLPVEDEVRCQEHVVAELKCHEDPGLCSRRSHSHLVPLGSEPCGIVALVTDLQDHGDVTFLVSRRQTRGGRAQHQGLGLVSRHCQQHEPH